MGKLEERNNNNVIRGMIMQVIDMSIVQQLQDVGGGDGGGKEK